jgi:hypothetical protein
MAERGESCIAPQPKTAKHREQAPKLLIPPVALAGEPPQLGVDPHRIGFLLHGRAGQALRSWFSDTPL